MPLVSGDVVAPLGPCSVSVVPTALAAGVMVPEMVHVCGFTEAADEGFAPAVPQPSRKIKPSERQRETKPHFRAFLPTSTLLS